MAPVLEAQDLRVAKSQEEPGWTFQLREGFNLLYNSRENQSTALALTLAGRHRSVSGTIMLTGSPASTRRRYKEVALGGAAEVDTLERLVPVRAVIREQVAWSSRPWTHVPRQILGHRFVEPWLEPLGLADLDLSLPVGELPTLDRYALRILLGLVGRPKARLLVADDVDQLKSTQLRAEMLERFDAVSRHLPVVVFTVNLLPTDPVDAVIDLSEEKA